MAGAGAAAVFVEGDVAYPVQAVFDGPVATCQGEQLGGGGALGAAAGDPADDLMAGLAGGEVERDAFDLEDLLAVGEVDVAVERGAGPDAAGFEATVGLLERLVLRGG